MHQTLRLTLSLSICQQESCLDECFCVSQYLHSPFSLFHTLIYHDISCLECITTPKYHHNIFASIYKALSSLISTLTSILIIYSLMFLNCCHSLGIMLHVKANLAYSAIPFSLSGNIPESKYLFI